MFFWIKRHKIIFGLIFVAFLSVISFFVFKDKSNEPDYEVVLSEQGDVVKEVNVTGEVKATQELSLAFEIGGRVAEVKVKVGDNVKKDQILASLNGGELSASLVQAQADLLAEQAKLQELERGSRPEEIRSARTKVENSQRSLEDAENNLAAVQTKVEADLLLAYNNAVTAAQGAAHSAKASLLTLSDIQYNHLTGETEEEQRVALAKEEAVYQLFGLRNNGWASSQYLSTMSGGVYGEVQTLSTLSDFELIEDSCADMIVVLQKVQAVLNLVPVDDQFSATEKTNLATEKSSIATGLGTLSAEVQDINVQEALNQSNIVSAESKIVTAKNSLALAEDDLNLLLAGTSVESIEIQRARVAAKLANVKNYQSQFEKTLLKAPVEGAIAKKDIRVGQLASANQTVFELISKSKFQVEARIPEVDIEEVNVGDVAEVTLDAFGNDIVFDATVVSIDSAETVVEGVATYKAVFEFSDMNDSVRSGMTANIDIEAEKRETVIYVPLRAVATRGQEKYVVVLEDDGSVNEVTVITGLRGSDRTIEIKSGISAGQKIILSKLGKD